MADKKLLFSIYDDVTKMYEPPFLDINKGSAMRRIQDLMQSNPQSPYTKFPDNFTLMEIGEFTEETGLIHQDTLEHVVDLKEIQPTKE
ncbi:nonstructural protein [Microviridae sp.]|jgi:hypothetical protein|nr:nonstructural protein [Microviridae sp.]